MATVTPEGMDDYLALVRAFPLERIRDQAHLDAALAVIDRLLARSARSEAENAYLDALTDLVETYEDAHVAFPPQTGVGVLSSLIEENGLRQHDLIPVFGTQSIASEILSGKRQLTRGHITRLAQYFNVSPAVFFDDPAP